MKSLSQLVSGCKGTNKFDTNKQNLNKMGRILGIDVGTNSLGLVVRDEDISTNPTEQIVFSSVNLFDSGVGSGQNGEFSFAAERTKFRRPRKLYKVRRYRKWETLKLLIENSDKKYCPLSPSELEHWTTYDKKRGLKRTYPINAIQFQQWIRLDFDGDGIPDYSSPYELRNELATKQLDFEEEINRFKLGRAIYHIAERRGFKSSKGESIKEQEDTETENKELQQSELDRALPFDKSLYPTVGCALYAINKSGQRVRRECSVVRKQYKEEIEYIFNFQKGLDTQSGLYKRLISEKRKEGTIFYKSPLKSQKGLVGMCTLEPNKPRCPQSRPEYEKFRAWSFINSIRYGINCNKELSIETKKALFDEVFVRATDFRFETIRKWIERKTGEHLIYKTDRKQRTINYKDNTPIIACSVTFRFLQLLGDDWQNWSFSPNAQHTNSKDKNHWHPTTYHWEDVWHVCFSADEEEPLQLFADKSKLDYPLLQRLWKTMPIAYANLSLKAINNINRFLEKGLIYNEACLLAKLPDIFKEKWTDEVENILFDSITSIIKANSEERKITNIANTLIANYKSKADEEKQGYKDYSYHLSGEDLCDIEKCAAGFYGIRTWSEKEEEERKNIINHIAQLYQRFFHDEKRQYIKPNKIEDSIKQFLADNFEELNPRSLSKLYHHSQIEYYKPASIRRVDKGDKVLYMKLLENPAIASLRNPMALRVLYTLKRKVNDLLIEGIINEDDTRVVVEVTRKLNDANMRWAIKHYQDIHNAENDEFRKMINEITDIPKVRMLVEQHDCNGKISSGKDSSKQEYYYERYMSNLIKKYRLWVEQGGFCIYTRKPITISSLINGESVDVEHTIPRSISFDDSLCNKTLCDSNFNQKVKANRIPSQLPNYEEILLNIKPWIEKVEDIRGRITFWKNKAKKAQTKEQKDNAIRQRHLWELELEYWGKKVNAFLIKEVTTGFRNNQLVDTSIIAKYTMHFLKSVFSRVEVQKGKITSDFRKILGIQDDDTLKVRDSNSHHAIDAMVLTFIPVAARRDELLEVFFKRQDAKDMGHDVSQFDDEIKLLLRKNGITANFTEIVENIKSTVLAFYERKSQALTPTKRRKRVRGQIVAQRDERGNTIMEKDGYGNFKTDRSGHRIPLAKHWIKGDSIRGELHDKTYYGAITQHGDDEIKYVLRIPLKYKTNSLDKGFKSWDELEKAIVNKSLVEMMKSQFPEGTSLKEACEQGIYMMDNEGNRKNRIRHVRCYASSVTNPIKVREQVYKSSKDYKNYYYTRNGENIAYALYSFGNKRTFDCLSLMDASKISKAEGIHHLGFIFPDSKEVIDKKGQRTIYNKVFTLIPGQMVVLKREGEMLASLTQEEISHRLYRLKRIYSPDDGRLQLQHHLESRDDKALEQAYPNNGKSGKNGFSIINYETPYPRLLLSLSNQNFWIEGTDFVIKNGKVIAL